MSVNTSLPKLYSAEILHPEALDFLAGKVELTGPNRRPLEGEDISPYLKDAEGLINPYFTVNASFLEMAPRLRVVSNVSVGYNNLDVEELKKRGILATHTPGVMSTSVADLILCLMTACCRRAAAANGRTTRSSSGSAQTYPEPSWAYWAAAGSAACLQKKQRQASIWTSHISTATEISRRKKRSASDLKPEMSFSAVRISSLCSHPQCRDLAFDRGQRIRPDERGCCLYQHGQRISCR